MTKREDKITEKKFNQLKGTEADLVRDLQKVVQEPTKEAELSDDIFNNHQAWLKVIMPNYSPEIHLGIIKGYETDSRYESYYDDKAGKGATKILIRIVKQHLAK
ncbi:TipAS antibiotic-recognition domain-containing protein [Lactobacillus sp. ESL0785]|uniref:TipAS antibiotic-recognition domain-containing protein n=1 Tax=Lactobacillus sp. ESL0785 TaxID=2983232 RepID=UPI0023F74A3A|nr:TipAS antibiotic-recognition domain-containing protein [Lactobacillus sp. ESL0785]WEV70253.1 TipAS antibiotic-recognition domain-containing protein [Lactobacillus sp. ESL0785]